MHPLAHMLTGALIGQLAPTPARAVVGGLLSHLVLDVLPHAEGKTFKSEPVSGHGADLLEAGLEFIAGIVILGWLIGSCHGFRPLYLGWGTFAALLPDLINLPIELFFGITILHSRRLHWTVTRRHAVWGILTQVAVVVAAAASLWQVGGCG